MQAEHQQPVAGSSRTTLRVATLNVWYLREPIALANALRAKLPAPLDVLALQEVYDMHDLATFAEALGMKVAVKRVADARVGLSNVLLVCMGEADVTDVERASSSSMWSSAELPLASHSSSRGSASSAHIWIIAKSTCASAS